MGAGAVSRGKDPALGCGHVMQPSTEGSPCARLTCAHLIFTTACRVGSWTAYRRGAVCSRSQSW